MAYTTTFTTSVNGSLDRTYTLSQQLSGDAKFSFNDVARSGLQTGFVAFSFDTGKSSFLGMSTNVLTYPIKIQVDGTGSNKNVFFVSNTSQALLTNFNTSACVDASGRIFSGVSSGVYVTNTGNLDVTFYIDALYNVSPNLG
jgi:hypothetical protein